MREAIYTCKGRQRHQRLDPLRTYQYSLIGCYGHVDTTTSIMPTTLFNDSPTRHDAEWSRVKWQEVPNSGRLGEIQGTVRGCTMLRANIREFAEGCGHATLVIVDVTPAPARPVLTVQAAA